MIKYNLQFFAKDGPGGQRTEEIKRCEKKRSGC